MGLSQFKKHSSNAYYVQCIFSSLRRYNQLHLIIKKQYVNFSKEINLGDSISSIKIIIFKTFQSAKYIPINYLI